METWAVVSFRTWKVDGSVVLSLIVRSRGRNCLFPVLGHAIWRGWSVGCDELVMSVMGSAVIMLSMLARASCEENLMVSVHANSALVLKSCSLKMILSLKTKQLYFKYVDD